ncbi:hypothetical protein LB505_013570 [Fusarium chuoi]|nr:hypothetical protein LB505_013570 [Fusarium chuoi]
MEAAEKQSDLKMPVEQELDHNSGEMNDITEVEKKVLSKFDKFVMPQMALLVLFAYLDRTNIAGVSSLWELASFIATAKSSPVEYFSVSSRPVSFLLSLSSSLRSIHLRRKENAWRFFTSLLRSLEHLVDLSHMAFSPWVHDMVCLLGDGCSSSRVPFHSSSEPFAG